MRILFDHQIQTLQKHGGVSRYFFELISNLKKDNQTEVVLPRIYSSNEYFSKIPNSIKTEPLSFLDDLKRPLLKKIIRKINYNLKIRFNRKASIRELKKQNFDIFHPTYYDPYFLKYLNGKPFVLTIYDMIYEIYPDYFNSLNKTKENKALLAQKAKKIIAISESTKNDIVKYLGISPEKIEVIYLANSLENKEETVSIPNRYILYVGARGRYKNFNIFLRSFSQSLERNPDLHLICTGSTKFNANEIALLKELKVENRCSLIEANDRQLFFLYKHALCFAFPSLYEGFGLPILEAFSADCPVLASDNNCFKEIAGPAALYFKPTDPTSITKAMEEIIDNESLRQELAKKGRERLQQFSWQKTAKQTVDLYTECLK